MFSLGQNVFLHGLVGLMTLFIGKCVKLASKVCGPQSPDVIVHLPDCHKFSSSETIKTLVI